MRNSYYPFGLSHGNMSYVREGRAKNQFLYNGKELVEGFDLGWYDYGARYYAPDLGRWHAVDPLAEKYMGYSAYNYVVNNPIIFIDPDGRSLCESGDCEEGKKNSSSEDNKSEVTNTMQNWVKSLPDMSLEITVTLGPQVGFELGDFLAADLTVANVEVLKDETKLEDGELTVKKKILTKEANESDDEIQDSKTQVENSIGLELLGFGGKIGQKQNIDGDGFSSDYVTFKEFSASEGGLSGTYIEETKKDGSTEVKKESSFTAGAKFILGIELKYKTSSEQD